MVSTPGIDCSNWQKKIDWAAVAASGIQFMFAKATEGTGYADPWFLRNWEQAKAHGMLPGAYHFARPDLNSAWAEAEFFVEQMGGKTFEPGELIALDLEVGRGDLADWALEWLALVEQGCGVKPLLYSGHWFMAPHGLEGRADLADYGLWLASYQDTPPPTPDPWPVTALWQYSATGSVPGVRGPCDLDQFNGSLAQLKKYGAP